MTQSESFSWQPTYKGCTGSNDFGLLRDKPENQSKPKLFSLYFSKTVVIVGIVAGFTFAICLILADKYQKSAKISHHYASSSIYEKDGEKFEFFKSYYNGSKRDAAVTPSVDDTLLNSIGLKRIQNISKNIRIDDINHLMPITTVLHSINATRGGRTYNADKDTIILQQLNIPKANSSKGILIKKVSSLADLLKRTELKSVHVPQVTNENENLITTTEANAMQFAQLENYRHHVTAKNLQDLLKYITCNKAADCVPVGSSSWPDETADSIQSTSTDFTQRVELKNGGETNGRSLDDDQRLQLHTMIDTSQATQDMNSGSHNDIPQLLSGIDTIYSEATEPLYYTPYGYEQLSQPTVFDPFYHYRASNPMDINDLEPMASKEHRFFHRFSNRMYNTQRDGQEKPRIYTPGLEPYLKPPTPPPNTALSFTPSYTTTTFNGYDDGSNAQEELKAEATAVEPTTHIKPISLMVEIFPATDYELPSSVGLFQEHTPPYPQQQKQTSRDTIQSNNALWLPWKLGSLSQNKMRLFVNLFPQHSRSSK